MGMKKLQEIARIYREEGLGFISAAIIQHASLPHQKIARGSAGDLPTLAIQHQLTHPSIIVIGEVVAIAGLAAEAANAAAAEASLENKKPRNLPGSFAVAI
jgi:siroheme synthase